MKTTSLKPEASLIIAVYNKPDFLEKIFVSILNQTCRNFEVVIADDGSGPGICDVIEKYSARFSFPCIHVWHEDNGFRKTVIVNKAVAASHADYLVFIDGDCILHHRFVETHLHYRREGIVLSGRRVAMNKDLSESVSLDDIRSMRIERPSFWWRSCVASDRKHGFYLPLIFWLDNIVKTGHTILGCNFSVYRSDYYAVNGYDERIIGRSMEDTNLEARLRLNGVRIKSVTRQALQYHLFHDFDPSPHSPEAMKKFFFPDNSWTNDGIKKDCTD
jgi:glycosyltransferase involved in cell wall biosynthesis